MKRHDTTRFDNLTDKLHELWITAIIVGAPVYGLWAVQQLPGV